MKFGGLVDNKTDSPVDGFSVLRSQNNQRSLRSVVAPLMLTSLVDAFAVIVIYLLVSTSQAPTEAEIYDDIKLPTARHSQLIEPGVNVRVVGQQYFVGQDTYTPSDLLEKLKKIDSEYEQSTDARRGKLVIQADAKASFRAINPLLSIAAQSGFDQIKFATVEGTR